MRFLLINELSQRFANALLCIYARQLKKLSDARRVKEAGDAAKKRVEEASRAQAESDRARAAKESLELASQRARAAQEALQQPAVHDAAPNGKGKSTAQSEARAQSESRRRAGSLVQEKKLQRMKRYQELKSLIVERYTAEDILSFIDRDAAGDMTMADWIAAFSGARSAAVGATTEHDDEAAGRTAREACGADALRETGREREGMREGEVGSGGGSEVSQKSLDAEDVEIIRRIFAKLDKSRDDDVEEPSEPQTQTQTQRQTQAQAQTRAPSAPGSSKPEQLQAPTPTQASQNAAAWGSGHLTSTRGEGGGRGRGGRQRSPRNRVERDIEHDTSGAA